MIVKASHCSARHMTRTLYRSPSTITRELARFAAWADWAAVAACAPVAYDAQTASLRTRRAGFGVPSTIRASQT